jgi:hypothetical protein
MNLENFSLEEKNLIISAILVFSTEAHPYPTEENLKYFKDAFIINRLKTNAHKIAPEYRTSLRNNKKARKLIFFGTYFIDPIPS